MAYISQGSHTGQLDFCNWLADSSTTAVKSTNVDFLNQTHYFSIK